MIQSIEQFIKAIRDDSSSWPKEQPRWFRGEPVSDTPLLPTLYRCGFSSQENSLLQTFRTRAPGFHHEVPDRENTDQWLFLARHVGLPTRLLDWSESALVGLHFALREKQPSVVWMLNPLHLNHLAANTPTNINPDNFREFPLTWHPSIAYENIRGAWEGDGPGAELPVAVHPTYVHPRMRGQSGCFTIQGKRREGLNVLAPETALKRYALDPECRESILGDLMILGVTDSVAFPDLDGLAGELKMRFPAASLQDPYKGVG